MDIKVIIKYTDDTAEIRQSFNSLSDATEFLRYAQSALEIAGNDATRAYELMTF